jgi:pimeloyl-ACP methyl ester carboxylesterase
MGRGGTRSAQPLARDRIKQAKTLSLPAIYVQGEKDGVNPPPVSESIHQKFTGPFERMLLQNVGHFPQREDPDTVARELTVFLGRHL